MTNDLPPEVSSLFWLGYDSDGAYYDIAALAKELGRYNDRL
jgi:hypothetical protein